MGKIKSPKKKAAKTVSKDKQFVRKVEKPEVTQVTVLEVEEPEIDVYSYRKELLIKMAIHGPCYDDDFCKENWHCNVCGEGMGACNSRQLCRKTRCDNQYEVDELEMQRFNAMEEVEKRKKKVTVDSPKGAVKLVVEK